LEKKGYEDACKERCTDSAGKAKLERTKKSGAERGEGDGAFGFWGGKITSRLPPETEQQRIALSEERTGGPQPLAEKKISQNEDIKRENNLRLLTISGGKTPLGGITKKGWFIGGGGERRVRRKENKKNSLQRRKLKGCLNSGGSAASYLGRVNRVPEEGKRELGEKYKAPGLHRVKRGKCCHWAVKGCEGRPAGRGGGGARTG